MTVLAGFAALKWSSGAAAQDDAIPLSKALASLTKHAFDGFAVDRGNRISQVGSVTIYEMAFTIVDLSECQIRVEDNDRSNASDVASCKGYAGTDASLAAAAFSSLVGQLREFVGKSAYVYVADTTDDKSKLRHAQYLTDNQALIAIDMTERSSTFRITVSIRPAPTL